MSRTEYRLAFREGHRVSDDGPFGSHFVEDRSWMQVVSDLAEEGWTIFDIDWKNNRCMMEREVDD